MKGLGYRKPLKQQLGGKKKKTLGTAEEAWSYVW